LTAATGSPLRIWTIQPAGLYEKLRAKGVLFADGRHRDRSWDHAYRWMIDQMRRRLPPSQARFPWWGWYRWEGARRARPDLRAGGHLDKGQKGVRIELDLEETEVLLSDFEKWHFVLGGWFLSYDEAEDEWFDREKTRLGYRYADPHPQLLKSRVRASWDHIFDLKGGDPDWLGKMSNRAIQATFWELRLKDVTDVMFFTDRGRSF
jgi:hypothetical protein